MASVWISKRPTSAGATRYRVMYRVGGRESTPRHAGTFKTKREADARRPWVCGQLAALRAPNVSMLEDVQPTSPTFAEFAARWQASRVDVRERTAIQHRTSLGRILPLLGAQPVGEITTADLAGVVAQLSADGIAPQSIRKSIAATAMVLDLAGIADNPARDRVQVRLPRTEADAIKPPLAEHDAVVGWVLPARYVVALLVLDATGARVGELEAATVGDLDEGRKAWLVPAAVANPRRPRWVRLPDDLYAAVVAQLPPHEDRDPSAQLLASVTVTRLRLALGRASRGARVPHFAPHAPGPRRISLWHRQGISWAEIRESVGQRSKLVTAHTYSHALVGSEHEADRAELPGRARAVHTSVHTSGMK
jgi:integrase